MTAPADPEPGLALDLDALREGLEAAVRAAGEAIMALLERGNVRVREKKHWEGPVTEADYAADDTLHRMLMPLIPGAHWLSEESKQKAPLIHGEPTWVVDPLDGTREFVRGIPEWGVSVGFFVNNRLTLGAMALPTEGAEGSGGIVLSGLIDGERREARRDGVAMPSLVPDREPRRVVVSRNDYEYRHLQVRLPFEVYPCGSAVMKLAHAADGTADVYLATGPRSVWDVAGGAAVLEAAGGALIQFNGRPLVLSPQQVEVPAFAAGEPGTALALLRRIGGRA